MIIDIILLIASIVLFIFMLRKPVPSFMHYVLISILALFTGSRISNLMTDFGMTPSVIGQIWMWIGIVLIVSFIAGLIIGKWLKSMRN
jgi:hypothetical protein